LQCDSTAENTYSPQQRAQSNDCPLSPEFNVHRIP
jgi:hypothetical protein